MKQFIFYTCTLWLILWSQIFNNHFLGGSWFSPNLVLIAVLYFGLARGPLVGELVGLLWGLLIDASSLGLMGIHMLLYTLAGYIGGILRRQLDETKVWTQTVLCFSVSIFYFTLYTVLDRLLSGMGRPLDWKTTTQPLMNALLAPVLFWLLGQWDRIWDILPKERSPW
jgi:rod shape-determining protein MreD